MKCQNFFMIIMTLPMIVIENSKGDKNADSCFDLMYSSSSAVVCAGFCT